METAILICCAVIIILLIAILILVCRTSGRNFSDDIKNAVDSILETEERNISDSTVKLIDVIGKNIIDSQENRQKISSEQIGQIKTNMENLQNETKKSLDGINAIVTEKMQSTLDEKINNAFKTISDSIGGLSKILSDSQDKQGRLTEEKLEKLNASFEKIRKDITDTLTQISESNTHSIRELRRENQESLDKINSSVNEKLQKTLDDKISKSFETVNQRLKDVYEGLGEMKNVANGVTDLKKVLSNVKTRGTLGELQLGSILGEILAPEQYSGQVKMAGDDRRMVDYAVKLPGTNGESIWLPIDSKFPGDTYAELQNAYDTGDVNLIKDARRKLSDEIKRCAKDISQKYIQPPYTTNFAIMFLPFEGLYSEVVSMGLIEELQHDFKISIAGPSTMAAMLSSLRMGFNTLAIQKKTGEIENILSAVKKEFSTFEEGLNNARVRIQKADSELEKLIGTRTRAINKKLSSVSELESSEEASMLLGISQ